PTNMSDQRRPYGRKLAGLALLLAVLLGVGLLLSACTQAAGAGQQAAAPSSRSAADAYNAAMSLTYSGKCRQAIPIFLEALTKNPMYVNAYGGLGNCYQSMGSFNEAIAEYDKAIQLDPTGYGLYMQRAGAEYNNGSGGSAIADLNTALRLAPPQAITYVSIAAAFASYVDFADAVKAYTLAIQKVPGNPSFYEQRAQVYLQMQDPTRAFADYQTAIKASSTPSVRATVYSDLAAAYQGQGDYANALTAVRQAIQLLP